MADSDIAQAEADALLALEKRPVNAEEWKYPDFGGRVAIPLVSADQHERFFLDVRRSRVDLAKGTYQNRCRQTVILARLDFGGRPHRNPDGNRIGSPHLQLYREGYADKLAFLVPSERFADLTENWLMLEDFMLYCNIVDPPSFAGGCSHDQRCAAAA